MPYVLTVTEPMTGYAIGQRIYDQTEIDQIMQFGHSHTVKRVWVDDADMPKAEPEQVVEAPAEPKGKTKPDTASK